MNFKILLEFFIKMEKEQTDIRTDKDRQPARGKGEGGGGGGEVHASYRFVMPTLKANEDQNANEI